MSAPVTRKQLERLSVGRSLAAVQRRWGPLNEAQGTWLRHQGVSVDAILEPTPIGAARRAAERGDIPVIRVGKLLRVPVIQMEKNLASEEGK